MHMSALLPLVANPPPVNGEDVTGHVLQTNITNVGAIISVNDGFDGFGKRDFIADNPRQRVPFAGTQTQDMLVYFELRNMRQKITLVKLGPIAPGVHTFSGDWFSGTFQDIGYAFGSAITGTVVQSQCTLAANPVSADPVQLGEWESSDFTGAGYGTAPVDFTITLNNCVSDPNQGDPWRVATAHIRLEGANGSAPLPGTDGLFSLSSDSTAAGVGIQILRDDGATPIPLLRDVPVTAIQPSGDTVLPFTARLLQTGPVTPGIAKGSLNFTITYQ
jgi:type 1 fimbria pilin